MADGHLFNSISLGGRGGTNAGQLRIHSGGILWKKTGGGKAVEVDKADVVGLTWMKVPRSNQLGVRIKDGLYYKFTGFRDQDVATVTSFLQSSCGITPEEKQLSVSGKNWGEVDLNGNMLTFLVGSKQAFEVSLADVSQTQLQGKNDVILEFHVDDTTGANEKDSLMEISFHIPNSNTQFVGDENCPSAQVFRDKIMSMADVGAGGEESVVTFEGIAILTPRGRYNVELHLSFLRLQGQANDFKIQYSSVVRLFLLPKSNQPHTFVVVTLDPPIRKGQTLYPHIVLQFETDYVVESTLSMNEDLLNSKYKDKLEPSYKGLIHEVFILIMRGLSGAKVTRPGKFRSCQDGYAVKSSLKAEDGVLYPLEKGFFFLPKPPTLILHEEIDYVEFERHAAGGANMHYFDLLIRLKSEQEHLFRNIQRNEYHNLFDFISGKGLKIMNLGDIRTTDGVTAVLQNDDDDAVDPHLERIKNAAGGDESDEEDEDFVADGDDGGSPTDDSGNEESDASESGGEKEVNHYIHSCSASVKLVLHLMNGEFRNQPKRNPRKNWLLQRHPLVGVSLKMVMKMVRRRGNRRKRRIQMHQRGPCLVLCFSHRARGRISRKLTLELHSLMWGEFLVRNGRSCQLRRKNHLKQRPKLIKCVTRMKSVVTRTLSR